MVLKNRVRYLEQALRNAREKPSQLSIIANRRDQAERDARREALKDYYEQERTERLRRSPWMLEIDQQVEDNRNAFLRSRGLKPEPSEIPKELRQRARALLARKQAISRSS